MRHFDPGDMHGIAIASHILKQATCSVVGPLSGGEEDLDPDD